jgi:hypothetical protein
MFLHTHPFDPVVFLVDFDPADVFRHLDVVDLCPFVDEVGTQRDSDLVNRE